MHHISTNEIQNRPHFLPDLEALKELCGEDWRDKVIFVSSHWNDLGEGEENLKEGHVDAYWSYMKENGSKMQRYNVPSHEAAWDILGPLIEGAQKAREKRLEEELEELKLRKFISDDAFSRISQFLQKKAEFMRTLTSRLGQVIYDPVTGDSRMNVEMTDMEKKRYADLNLEARFLWQEIERDVDAVELERWLIAGTRRYASSFFQNRLVSNRFLVK